MPQPASPPRIVRFGIFELDLASAELRKHGLRVRIQEQPYQVLSALLERPGEVVSREELIRRLWPNGTFVDFERGLNAAVTRLRQTLSDSAENPRYVETVARRGYRFVTSVESLTQRNASAQENMHEHGSKGADLLVGREAVLRSTRLRLFFPAAAFAFLILAGAVLLLPRSFTSRSGQDYVQITDFADSAISPALSADGRTVAFIRGNEWFLSREQIWLKSLPDGEPVQLTRDPRAKFAPAFSPDGSRLAYSAVDPARTAWDTYSIPILGGEPRLLMPNAEGLTWITREFLLFSEIKKGIHMGVVTARENRSEARDVYVPEHERAMAHFSYPSPDRKWVLVVEMDHTAAWQPCRLVPFDGSSRGHTVGPNGACTSAGWSPDGKWMYFTVAGATADKQHHRGSSGANLWRQRFPRGDAEQVTFGPAEAQGVAVAPDGRSVITSLGMQQSAVWIHDSRGDRPLSSVGNASSPMFSPDGSRVFYLVNRGTSETENELWATHPGTERSERLVSGFHITGYDISESGTEAVFAAKPVRGESQIWRASLDRLFSPVLIASNGEDAPYFGLNGEILFRMSDGKANYLYRMNRDGSGRTKVVHHPILNVMSVSPDRLWIATLVPVNDEQAKFAEIAIPAGGGASRRICSGFCVARWSPDGKYFYVTLQSGSLGETAAIPLGAGQSLPDLPASGFRSLAEALAMSEIPVIGHANVAPGPNPSVFAYRKMAMHRNLFRIPVP